MVTGFVNNFRKILPHEEGFVDNFLTHSAIGVEAAKEFQLLLSNDGMFEKHLAKICYLEDQADNITRDTLKAIHRTFITPFGRSDIREMITCLDDTVDIMKTASKRIKLRGITTFTPQMQGMSAKIVRCTELIHEALPMLRSINKNFADIIKICEEIKRLEGEADDLHDSGLAEIWNTPNNLTEIEYTVQTFSAGNRLEKRLVENQQPLSAGEKLIWEDIYGQIESISDRCEDTADVISCIVEEQV